MVPWVAAPRPVLRATPAGVTHCHPQMHYLGHSQPYHQDNLSHVELVYQLNIN